MLNECLPLSSAQTLQPTAAVTGNINSNTQVVKVWNES